MVAFAKLPTTAKAMSSTLIECGCDMNCFKESLPRQHSRQAKRIWTSYSKFGAKIASKIANLDAAQKRCDLGLRVPPR